MGQQVTAGSQLKDDTLQASPRWCEDNNTDLPKANRATDSVRVSRHFQASAGLCSGALPLGPDVLVTDITGSSAKVYWSINQTEDARKVHLELLLDEGADGLSEVAFFEVGGSQSSWDFPDGTLERGSGPYRVQVVLETGSEDAPKLTKPSRSEPFWAAEAPWQVPLTLTEVECESFTVGWNLPDDDGGVQIEEFEVRVRCDAKESDASTRWTHQLLLDADTRSSSFNGFSPGSGPHHVQVRARNLAGLWSKPSEVQVFTAYLAPKAPTQVSARLLPGWARRLSPWSLVESEQEVDTDVVKLEFISPSHNGGHPIESYIINAEEEVSEASEVGEKPGPKKRSIEVPVSAVATTDEVRPGGTMCNCHVAVEPNRSYIFTVEASNGRRGTASLPSVPVFAPARVPKVPDAPQVFAAEGMAAELRWSCLSTGGGLPLEGFKIGVAMDTGHTPEVHREVTYPLAAVAEQVTEEALISCKTRVEGLLPNARYCFMLAACNGAGTSRWSSLSSFLQTPAAPPHSPVNTVATVAQDSEQQVVVTISWECPPELPGSGPLAAFDLQMLPLEMQQVRPSSDRRLVRERVAAPGAKAGDRIRWAKALAAPGYYVIEVTAESSNGQKSAPAVLTLEAQPEAFPPSLAELMVSPKWSEEPYLALGPAADSVPRFGNLEGTWLQTLLLWGEPGAGIGEKTRTLPWSIDVLCFFRRPGSSQVFRATLASQVTTSRLQVALPTHVPMSLRLAVKLDPKLAARTPRQPMSEPLAIMFNDDGEPLQPIWEIWARNHPDGQPARWTSIPQELQQCIEAAWLEGHPKVALQLPHATEGRMAPGSYELTFGDERQTQSTVKKVGPGGWTAKARRTVLANEDDTFAAAAVSSDELCVVCMERRRTHAFMHADTGDGHLAVCVDCAEAYRAEAAVPGGTRAVRTCPMCRRGFSALQRIYQ